MFIEVAPGHIINDLHIVQITPEGHAQLTSGNVVTLDEDSRKHLYDSLSDKKMLPENASDIDETAAETTRHEDVAAEITRENVASENLAEEKAYTEF